MTVFLSADATAPADRLVSVTPNDSTDIGPFRGLWVGGAGNVAIIAANDSSAVTITGVAAGTILPIAGTRVMSTNTTATNIVALL